MRTSSLALCFLLFAVTVTAQEIWNTGTVVLANGKVIQGETAVKLDCHAVLFRRGEEVMALPAHKILSVSFFDSFEESLRKYVSLQMAVGALTKYELFEVLVEGSVSILRREQIGWSSVNLDFIDFDYFVLHDNHLLPLHKFRKDVYPDLAANESLELRKFVKENRLSPNKLLDIVKIANHYNLQGSATSQLAKN